MATCDHCILIDSGDKQSIGTCTYISNVSST